MSTLEDHIVAMAARVSHMKVLGVDLFNAAVKTFSALYPTETIPKDLPDLCEWLNASDIQLNEWRCSAGRAGADQALKFVLSWYEDLDLDALETLRIGSAILSDEEKIKKRQARAYDIAQYAAVHRFIPDPADLEVPEEEAQEGEATGDDDAESSEEKVDEELEADTPPAATSISTDPSCSTSASAPGAGNA